MWHYSWSRSHQLRVHSRPYAYCYLVLLASHHVRTMIMDYSGLSRVHIYESKYAVPSISFLNILTTIELIAHNQLTI